MDGDASKAVIGEKRNLWVILILLKAPMFVMAMIFAVMSSRSNALESIALLLGFFYSLFALAILVLPAFWQGSLGYREIIKRIMRRSDGLSIVLAILPVAMWLVAVTIFNFQAGRPLGFFSPGVLFAPSKYQVQNLLSVLISVPSTLIGLLLFANASNYRDRIKFILMAIGITIFIRITQFGLNYFTFKAIQSPQFLQMISPVRDIALEIGKGIVILGLLQRGKSSIKSIATFLAAYFVIQFFAPLGWIEPMMIGLFGGGAIIWLVNYVQQAQQVKELSFGDDISDPLPS